LRSASSLVCPLLIHRREIASVYHKMSLRKDFYWTYTDEPHATRRKEILAKYPQIKDLYGFDPKTKYIVTILVALQFAIAFVLRDAPWWMVVLCSYCLGGFVAHSLVLAMHEISHNLAFIKPSYNRVLGVLANTATFFPHFSMFQKYHMEHHQYQGVDGIDVDIPTKWEGDFFTNAGLKTIFCFLQPLFYAIRPLVVKPKEPGFWEFVNWTTVITFDLLVIFLVGPKAAVYLAASLLLGSGLHPIAGHFIAEHYVFIKGQETYSYYGPFNWITFNVGYHNEHHDFPRIPGYRLPQVKAIAPEYYDSLPSYNSWTKVIYDYITDPSVGPFSRVLRKERTHRKST